MLMREFSARYWTIAELSNIAIDDKNFEIFADLLDEIRSHKIEFTEESIVVSGEYDLDAGRSNDCQAKVWEIFWHSKLSYLCLHAEFDWALNESEFSETFYVIPQHVFKMILVEYANVCREQEHLFDGGGVECAYASFYFEHTLDSIWKKRNSDKILTLREWLKENQMVEVVADGLGKVAKTKEVVTYRGVQYSGLYKNDE